jgi:hypothetical protein
MLDNAAIRAASWSRVSEFGGAKNPELPLLDFPEFRLRKLADVESRLLALIPIAVVMAGAPTEFALPFIEANDLFGTFTPQEQAMLEGREIREEAEAELSWAAEEISVLAWSIGSLKRLEPEQSAPDDLTAALPAVDEIVANSGWRDGLKFKPMEEQLLQLDLLYCWHWASVEMWMGGRESEVFEPGRALHRRRAMEWILNPAADWDYLDLDSEWTAG